ncbi:MAG: glycosyltransferase family 2 protein [Acidobacteria bacterium]|nr:glycosyltransferase family 2 protein [Acidobacteriota bacterium]
MRISVAMCSYNGAEFLPAQLASIAEQTRVPDEIVVCDDASTDDTRRVLESFARTSPIPVSLYFSDRNTGSLKNFERAIGLCTGDVIVLSDQDDVWRADKLQLQEQALRDHPKAGLVFSDAELVDKNLNTLGRRMWDQVGFDAHKQKLIRTGKSLDVLITGWTVTGATMAFRSDYVKLALPIPANIAMIHDGWIALTVASVADVVFIEEPLIKYRQHERQQIGAPPHKQTRSSEQPQPGGLQGFETALRRRNSAADLHRILSVLEERLAAAQNWFDCTRALAFVADYSLHLDVRANLPRKRLSRLPRILRELMTMRYHEYANGFKSAAKDLVS